MSSGCECCASTGASLLGSKCLGGGVIGEIRTPIEWRVVQGDWYAMSEEDDSDGDATKVRVVCPACDTETQAAISDVMGVVERHNEAVHDGEDVATVDPAVKEALAGLVAKDLGLDTGEDPM